MTRTSSPGIRAMAVPASPRPSRPPCACLQFLLDLSDRQAAEAVRCRIDFKYALAMDLDDPGFHHSVLTDFRDRLGRDDRADQLLSLALDRIREAEAGFPDLAEECRRAAGEGLWVLYREAASGDAEAVLDVLEFADPDQRRFHHFRSALER
ncbi:transposase, partial [Streptomyces atacamensis]|uniref:transposase n=1 Tax=Streptomyces atacamensis TaxID=531966 RepID=UPI00399CEF08